MNSLKNAVNNAKPRGEISISQSSDKLVNKFFDDLIDIFDLPEPLGDDIFRIIPEDAVYYVNDETITERKLPNVKQIYYNIELGEYEIINIVVTTDNGKKAKFRKQLR